MLHPSRTQLALAAAAVALPLGAAGILSTIGSAQSIGGPRTLHFVATEVGGFESKGRFGKGSVVGFEDRLRADDGTTGRGVGVCTITNLRRMEAFCHVVAVFPGGQLVFEFLNRESSKSQTVSVVGGTGAQRRRSRVRGRQGGRRRTDITVNLIGQGGGPPIIGRGDRRSRWVGEKQSLLTQRLLFVPSGVLSDGQDWLHDWVFDANGEAGQERRSLGTVQARGGRGARGQRRLSRRARVARASDRAPGTTAADPGARA